MSYEAIRFCSNCNLKPEELENLKPPKFLKTCPICKIAQYCDKNCQQQDYDARHKQICRYNIYVWTVSSQHLLSTYILYRSSLNQFMGSLGRATYTIHFISAQKSRVGIECTKAKDQLWSYCKFSCKSPKHIVELQWHHYFLIFIS